MRGTVIEMLTGLREDYLNRLWVKGYSKATLHVYGIYARQFIQYLAANEKIKDLDEMDFRLMDRYQAHLFSESRGLTRASQRHRLIGIRSFFKWMRREELIAVNPALEIELPKKAKRLPRDIFTEGEIEKMLGVVPCHTKLGLRDKALLELLYSTGIRASELAHLRIADILPAYRMIRIIHGKGMKERVVPIGIIAIKWVKKYLKLSRMHFKNAAILPWLFINLRGRQIHAETLSSVVQKYARLAEIKRYTCTHMIRHSMATHMVRREAPLRYLQEILGHRYIVSTQTYTRLMPMDLKHIHSKYHPRA